MTARVPPFRTRPWLTPLETLEGPAGVAAVVLDRRRQELALFTNAFRAAATGDDYRYTRSLAHIPSLLCAKPPERVAVIAVGTGSTAAAALRHKSVRRLDMVEISSEVFSLLPWFRPASDALFPRRASGDADKDTNNTPPTLDPRIVCDVEDGRRFVAKEGEPYDLVILEPLFPDTPSAYPFYTKQFYALAKARLDKGGILAQWIPIHATEPLSFRALVATFSVSFPHRAAYLVGESLLLLGSEEPLGLQAGRLAEALQSPELAADLRRSGCASVGISWPNASSATRGWASSGRAIRYPDDAPRIERLGILTKRDPAAFEKENLGLLIRARETFPNDPLPGLDQLPAGEQEARRAAGLAYLRARRALVLDESETLDPSDGSRDRGALTETTPHPFAALDGQRDSTARSVREGRGYLASGDVRSALRVFEKAAAVARDPVVWLGLALAYYRSDRAADAGFAMAVALALEPDSRPSSRRSGTIPRLSRSWRRSASRPRPSLRGFPTIRVRSPRWPRRSGRGPAAPNRGFGDSRARSRSPGLRDRAPQRIVGVAPRGRDPGRAHGRRGSCRPDALRHARQARRGAAKVNDPIVGLRRAVRARGGASRSRRRWIASSSGRLRSARRRGRRSPSLG